MRLLNKEDLTYLQKGAAILGSGGGGDPYYAFLMTNHLMEEQKEISLISIEELSDDDLVVPIAIMGAPLINKEKLLSGKEFAALLQMIENHFGIKPTVLMPGEIGGANAFTPLIASCFTSLPVLDGDLIGRAFPKLPMNSCHLHQCALPPAFLIDSLGNIVTIYASDIEKLEELARATTVAMGSSAIIALYILKGSLVRTFAVPHTISQAIEIGKSLLSENLAHLQPQVLIKGVITQVHQEIIDGFLKGYVILSNEETQVTLHFQNEYLMAQKEHRMMASTPDILMLIETASSSPITSEQLRYGLEVSLYQFPAPSIWTSPRGLKLVGPKAFGYELQQEEA